MQRKSAHTSHSTVTQLVFTRKLSLLLSFSRIYCHKLKIKFPEKSLKNKKIQGKFSFPRDEINSADLLNLKILLLCWLHKTLSGLPQYKRFLVIIKLAKNQKKLSVVKKSE